MGFFDNFVGFQYCIDYFENLKVDVFDQIVMLMFKICGDVEDFEYMFVGCVYIGEEGDVIFFVFDSIVFNVDF